MMERTFQSNSITRTLARMILRLKFWKLDVTVPAFSKYVLIGAPHTSNWDFIYFLLLMHAAGIRLHWIAKDSLFRWPSGGLMRWLGGIPVDRRSKNNFVLQIVEVFNKAENMVIAISPEGTRGKTHYWKTGFYYIASGAGVPIAFGFIDYARKVLGIGPTLLPSGDIQADFIQIQAFYADKQGRYPDQQGKVSLQAE